MFIIVGMNSIFIYLFFFNRWRRFYSQNHSSFSSLLFSWGGENTVEIITSLGIWAAMWYLVLLAV